MADHMELALAAAQATPYGSALHSLCAAICRARSLDPDEQMYVPKQEGDWPRWRVVLAEEVLRAMLRKELAI